MSTKKTQGKIVKMENNPFDKFSKVERVSSPENETPTMNNRIMPKKDFEAVIEHDKVYLSALQHALDFTLIKQNMLSVICLHVIENQTQELIEKHINELQEWADLKIKALDLKAQIIAQSRLLTDKEDHYRHVFLPQYNKEIAESNQNFKEIFENSKKLILEKPQGSEEIVGKLLSEFAWWEKLPKEEQKDEERKLQLFKPVKRLYNAWVRLSGDNKPEESKESANSKSDYKTVLSEKHK
jgi:hypothetical protein